MPSNNHLGGWCVDENFPTQGVSVLYTFVPVQQITKCKQKFQHDRITRGHNSMKQILTQYLLDLQQIMNETQHQALLGSKIYFLQKDFERSVIVCVLIDGRQQNTVLHSYLVNFIFFVTVTRGIEDSAMQKDSDFHHLHCNVDTASCNADN